MTRILRTLRYNVGPFDLLKKTLYCTTSLITDYKYTYVTY